MLENWRSNTRGIEWVFYK